MSQQAIASLLEEVTPSNETSFSKRNQARLAELQNVLRNRSWALGLNLLIDMVVVAERDSAFAEQFQQWLDRKESTLLLWKLVSRFESQFSNPLDYDNAKASIDAASAILKFG